MPGVELALAIVGTADLCFKYGKILVDQYESFKDAEAEINERVLRIESNWKRTAVQLKFLLQIWDTLDEEHQNLQNQILQVLANKLQTAISQVDRVLRKKRAKEGDNMTNMAGMKRWKYVLIKECLDKAIQDLEAWQKMFDPSWFLIMKVRSPLIDQELAKDDKIVVGSVRTASRLRDSLKDEPQIATSVFLPEDGLSSATRHNIPFSAAQIIQRPTSSKCFIVDSVTCDPETNISVLTKDVRELATKLSRADALNFGLLNCRGVVKVTDRLKRQVVNFNFIFNIPDGLENPRSLRSILISPGINQSLSDRFRVARQLATSVSYIHTYGFVHKSIRPETLLIFCNQRSLLGATFLVGFENFRLAEGRTTRFGDCVWEKDLYRHPDRQGLQPEKDYVMQHDIYSLGVCLLEIGLWESFVAYRDENPEPSLSTLLTALNTDTGEVKTAFLLKDVLLDLANQRLPSRMGDKYTEIVVTCLTCLDESNTDFGDHTEFEDEDGVLIGVRYIEKVRHGAIFMIVRSPKKTRFCSSLMEYRSELGHFDLIPEDACSEEVAEGFKRGHRTEVT